jgi:hypothetical protein
VFLERERSAGRLKFDPTGDGIRLMGTLLDTTAGRGGPKSEIQNPKPETNSNAQWSKAQNRQQDSSLGHSLLGA